MAKLQCVAASNLSIAWAQALANLMRSHGSEATPLVVRIEAGPEGEVQERADVRAVLCKHLEERGAPAIQTTASTIFPRALWNPADADGAKNLYARYERIWPRVKRHAGNRYGVYFRRLVAYQPRGGESTNQLQKVVDLYNSGVHRRSALQAVIFDPSRDHAKQIQRGFPCLQQLAFDAKGNTGELNVTAFFGAQYIFKRAYGNFVGLCDLGRFMAKQMGLRFAGLTSVAGVAQLGLKPAELDQLLRQVCDVAKEVSVA